jgi:C-terminal processing protease CtpA/Prc
MSVPIRCYVAVLVSVAWAVAALPAQDPPANPKIQEYEQNLNEIHAKAANIHQWNTKQGAIWSEKQCRSCHSATPSHASRFSELLLRTDTVANALGVEAAPLDGTLRAHLNIDDKSGLVLTSVPEGSEGAKAGLKLHDVVLNIDQQQVNDPGRFNELVGGLQGKKASIGLLRAGKPQSVEVAVPQLPLAMLEQHFDVEVFRAGVENRYRIGVTLSEADETLRSHLKLAGGEGLVVTEVVDESPAAKMGVKQHDVLTELDGKRLTSVDAANAQIQEIKDKTVVLKLLRSGQEVTCQIAPKKSSEPMHTFLESVVLDDRTQHRALVRWFNAGTGKVEGPANAAAQLAELKKQLAELGKTVENLEAVIAAPAPPAEEKKPEEEPEKK